MGENSQRTETTDFQNPSSLKKYLSDLIIRVMESSHNLNEDQQKRLITSTNTAQKLLATLSGVMQWENQSIKKDKEILALLERLEALESQTKLKRVQ